MISTTSESRFSPPDLEALVARSNIPVLIDCFTPGCGPCATLSPVLDELANSTQGRLAIEKIDVATYPEIAHRFGVRGVPTLLLFKGGQLHSSRTGAASRTQLLTWLSAQQAV
jgi:thioredoxin 1